MPCFISARSSIRMCVSFEGFNLICCGFLDVFCVDGIVLTWCGTVSDCATPAEVNKHLELGRDFLARGQLSDALTHYHAAVGECANLHPATNSAWRHLALCQGPVYSCHGVEDKMSCTLFTIVHILFLRLLSTYELNC